MKFHLPFVFFLAFILNNNLIANTIFSTHPEKSNFEALLELHEVSNEPLTFSLIKGRTLKGVCYQPLRPNFPRPSILFTQTITQDRSPLPKSTFERFAIGLYQRKKFSIERYYSLRFTSEKIFWGRYDENVTEARLEGNTLISRQYVVPITQTSISGHHHEKRLRLNGQFLVAIVRNVIPEEATEEIKSACYYWGLE
jgi:hypothetical protein